MKRILVCCMAGQSTSTMVETCVRELCEKNGIECTIKRCTIAEVDGALEDNDYDLVVPNCTVETHGVPTVSGLPFLIGFNTEETEEKILEILQKD